MQFHFLIFILHNEGSKATRQISSWGYHVQYAVTSLCKFRWSTIDAFIHSVWTQITLASSALKRLFNCLIFFLRVLETPEPDVIQSPPSIDRTFLWFCYAIKWRIGLASFKTTQHFSDGLLHTSSVQWQNTYLLVEWVLQRAIKHLGNSPPVSIAQPLEL